MAIVFDGPVTPDGLTTFVREVPPSPEFALDQILPDKYFDKNSIDFAELTQTNRTARFRTFDGRLHVSDRDATTLKSVKLPPLSTSISMGEYERLQLEFERNKGTDLKAIANAIYDDATNLTREVQARMELARGDVLVDYRFAMMAAAGEPLGLEADYGAPAGHLVAPGTAWTNTAAAVALTDLIAWVDVYIADAGRAPGALWTSQRVLRLLQKNKEIIDAMFGSTANRTRVTLDELNALLQSEGIPGVRTYDAVVDVDGTATRVIPDDRLLMVPADPSALGYTAWGVSATALELVKSSESDMSFEQAPGIVGVVEKDGPPYREWTYVDAVGMPVIANPRALIVADVA